MIEIIILTLYAMIVVGIINTKFHYGKNIDKYIAASIAFLLPSIPIIYFINYNWFSTTIILPLLLIATYYYLAYNSKAKGRKDIRFVTAKIFDIWFQQVFILLAYLLIKDLIASYLVLVFCAYFAIIHLPMFFITEKKKAATYTLASVIGGALFALILGYVAGGFWINYAIHFGFYVFAAFKMEKLLK
jgi:hypothetical protein